MEYLPLRMTFLPKEAIEKAEKELGETPEMRKLAFAEFRACIREDNPKFVCPTTDYYLLQFLRARKFNVKKAMALLQNYYDAKKSQKEIFGEPDFNVIRRSMEERFISILPYRDKDGSFIITIQLCYWNVDEFKFAALLHAGISLLMYTVDAHPISQICGIKLIIDAKGLSIKHLTHLPPRLLHFLVRSASQSAPLRIKGIHILNASFAIYYIWRFVKLILTEKLKKRIHFHGSGFKELHKDIDPAVLPDDFGGTLEYDRNLWIKQLDEFETRYYELMNYGYKSRKSSRQEQF